MTEACWYYCDWEKDDERYDGPVTLEALAELIRAEAVPYDVLVSTNATDWNAADAVPEVVRAVPFERERLIQEFIAYGETPEPDFGWASFRMYSFLEHMPERAWDLIVELMERAPSDDSLGYFAAGPLEDLLSKAGPDFIERVEQRAAASAKFRRAVTMLKRLDLTDEVSSRVRAIARAQ